MKKFKSISILKLIVLVIFGGYIFISSSCKKEEETPEPTNNAPVVSSVQVNPNSVNTGANAIISVTATDSENDELTYTYDVTGGSISGTGASVSWSAPSTEGTFTVNVSVSDGKSTATRSGTLVVSAPINNNPVINSITVNPSSANPGANVTITVDANDADNDQLQYHYQVTGGAISGSGSSVTWTAPSQAGAYSVTVTVTDGQGGETMGNGALSVDQPITQIIGTASFPAGTSGDLSNAKVSIYTSFNNWNQNIPLMYVAAAGSGSNISFTISDMPAGIYYLDVWKDTDNSGGWSYGDFVGWYGDGGLGSPSLTEISILEGETKNVSISMMLINGKMSIDNKKLQ